MSDVADRGKLESSLAREIAKLGAPALRKLITALGDPPSLSNVSDEFWRGYSAELRAALNTYLQRTYVQQSQTMSNEAGVSSAVDWNLINKDAADWASQYSFALVTGIQTTTRDALQVIIRDAIEQAQPLSDVRAAIEPLFGPVRASMIATTEITRAAAEGEMATVAQLASNGIVMRAKWMTREDEKVCPVCGSMDEKTADDNGMFTDDDGEQYDSPPAHPNCRCALGWEMVQ